MESRQHILQHFASACPTVLNNEKPTAWDGVLWKSIPAHYGTTDNLKFYPPLSPTAIPILTPADEIVDLLHQQKR